MYIKSLDHGSARSRFLANAIVGLALTLVVTIPIAAVLARLVV